jgi:SAM-dependent methyltransferase
MTRTTQRIADFFDRECCATASRSSPPLASSRGTAQMLLRSLSDSDLAGRTVLEIGSGDGSLSRALLERGAASVNGLDLSPQSVEAASRAAARAGLAGVSYQVADAAEAPLAQFDVIVSEKVFCCYPQPDQLLANTLPAARRLYAVVLPESNGVLGGVVRLVVTVGNLWLALQREQFRAYVHDIGALRRGVEAAGFELRASARHWGWRLLLFERTAGSAAQSPS